MQELKKNVNKIKNKKGTEISLCCWEALTFVNIVTVCTCCNSRNLILSVLEFKTKQALQSGRFA